MALLLGVDDEHREEGLWWLPNRVNHPVSGVLVHDPDDGASLKLMGTLSELNQEAFAGVGETYPVVHGITKTGRAITLVSALRQQLQINAPGIPNETVLAEAVLIGGHFEDRAERAFTESWVRFDGMEDWLDHRPFHLDPRTMALAIRTPGETVLAMTVDLKVLSSSIFKTEERELRSTRFAATVESMVGVRSAEPQTLGWHLERLNQLETLASLCFGRRLPRRSVRVLAPSGSADPGELSSVEVDVLARFFRDRRRGRTKRHNSPLLTLPNLMEGGGDPIGRWLSLYDQLRPVMDLFFRAIDDRTTFSEVTFQLTAQALEVYDRLSHPGGLVEAADYDAVRDALLAAIPSDAPPALRDKLKGMLEFGNEYNLRQRVRRLVDGLKSDLGPTPLGIDKGFVDRMVATRNYYTHFSPGLRSKIWKSSDVYRGAQRLNGLLIVLLLSELGVAPTKVLERLQAHQGFSSFLKS